MAKKQSKEVIANQEMLSEAWQYGGPDGFRQHYRDEGAQQERNRLIQTGKNGLLILWQAVEPFVINFVAERLFAFIEKKKKSKGERNREETSK